METCTFFGYDDVHATHADKILYALCRKRQIIELKLVDFGKIVYFCGEQEQSHSIDDNKNEDFLADRFDKCKHL